MIVLIALVIVWQMFFRDIKPLGSATLTWNAATDSDVVRYNVYYGSVKRSSDCPQGGYAKKVDAGKETSYQLNNLKDGETYYFSVTSVNTSGKESCFSEEMSKRIKITFWEKIKSII